MKNLKPLKIALAAYLLIVGIFAFINRDDIIVRAPEQPMKLERLIQHASSADSVLIGQQGLMYRVSEIEFNDLYELGTIISICKKFNKDDSPFTDSLIILVADIKSRRPI
jgi:hypothetical protein